jgi:hypothetical protein
MECVPVFVSGQVMQTPKPLLLHLPHQQGPDGIFCIDASTELMQWLIYFHEHASLPNNQDWSTLQELAIDWNLNGLNNYLTEEHQGAHRKRSFHNIFQSNNKRQRSMSVEEMMKYSDAVM